MTTFEAILYELSQVFLIPVMILILLAFCFSLAALGSFLMECWQKRSPQYQSELIHYQSTAPFTHTDDLELRIIKRLEWLRIITRITPMLGLVATMIAIGPALLALGDGQIKAVAGNMVVAFSAVIIALIAASITFGILTVRRRWLLEALREIERTAASKQQEA